MPDSVIPDRAFPDRAFPDSAFPDSATPDIAPRPPGAALWRGARGRCPACGQGRLFIGYLTPRPACPACAEDLSHQRADDGPAYFTLLIVAHVLGPLLLWIYPAYRPQPLTLAAILCTAAVVLSLALLPRIKGAMIALQWAWRMHGFDAAQKHGADARG